MTRRVVCTQVWVYDSAEIGRNACCVARHRFSQLFPTLDSSSSDASSAPTSTPQPPAPLLGHVDSVHYSYHSRAVFLFAGETVYELVAAGAGGEAAAAETGRWWLGVVPVGSWYNIWYDICDVE